MKRYLREKTIARIGRLVACGAVVIGSSTFVHATPAAAAPEFLRLHTFYSQARGDYFTTSDPVWTNYPASVRHLDYGHQDLEGFVYNPDNPQPAGTVPLYHWYSNTRGDNFLTTDPRWSGKVGDVRLDHDGYYLFRIEGFISPISVPGSVPLFNWWSKSRLDNAASAGAPWWGSTGITQRPDYERFSRPEGFLLDPDLIVTAFQTTGPATIGPDPDLASVPVRLVVRNQSRVPAARFKVSADYISSGGGKWHSSFVANSSILVAADDVHYAWTRHPLGPGGTVEFTGRMYVHRGSQPRALTVQADSCSGDEFMPTYCRALESSEENNTRTIAITVP